MRKKASILYALVARTKIPFVTTGKHLLLLGNICYYWETFVTTGKHLLLLGNICYYWETFVTTGKHLLLLGNICYYWETFVTTGKHLLLLGNEETQHYILIKSLNVLLRKRTKYGKAMNHCSRCLHGFATRISLESHLEMCREFKVQRTTMPTKPSLKFESFRKMI